MSFIQRDIIQVYLDSFNQQCRPQKKTVRFDDDHLAANTTAYNCLCYLIACNYVVFFNTVR